MLHTLLTDPKHPYSAGLIAARPDITQARPSLRAIPGRPLAAYEAPAGCAFADRCAHAAEPCSAAHPPVTELGAVRVRCLRAAELRLAPDADQDSADQDSADQDSADQHNGQPEDEHV